MTKVYPFLISLGIHLTTPHQQLEKRIASVRGHQHIYKDTGCHLQNSNIPRALFSWRIFWGNDTVALSLLFDN